MKEILVCGGTGCISGDSRLIHDAIEQELSRQGLEAGFKIKYTGCHGFCEQGPLILVTPEEKFYCKVKPQDVPNLIDSSDSVRTNEPKNQKHRHYYLTCAQSWVDSSV